jgi:hypothetical protein
MVCTARLTDAGDPNRRPYHRYDDVRRHFQQTIRLGVSLASRAMASGVGWSLCREPGAKYGGMCGNRSTTRSRGGDGTMTEP